jgi:hypothetical protein
VVIAQSIAPVPVPHGLLLPAGSLSWSWIPLTVLRRHWILLMDQNCPNQTPHHQHQSASEFQEVEVNLDQSCPNQTLLLLHLSA